MKGPFTLTMTAIDGAGTVIERLTMNVPTQKNLVEVQKAVSGALLGLGTLKAAVPSK